MLSRKLLIALFGFIIFIPQVGFCTSTPSAAPQAIDMGALGPSTGAKPVKKVVEHTYEQITYQNLYKLAWSYDAYGVEDVEALNNYLIITECKLFQKFFQNEFEWEKIKIATKQYLKSNKDKVPRYYEYVQPIFMGRYDYSLQGFPVVNAETFKGQKNFQFASFPVGVTECRKFDINFTKYPGTGVLTVSSPLTLSFVRVPMKLAQKYIEWRNKQGMFTDDKRQAYIRYRLRIDGYDGIKSYSGLQAFNFHGKLMRIDVFADQEMLLPLYNQSF